MFRIRDSTTNIYKKIIKECMERIFLNSIIDIIEDKELYVVF